MLKILEKIMQKLLFFLLLAVFGSLSAQNVNDVTFTGDYFNTHHSITTIEEGTFVHCTSLTSVTIPNSVTSIEYVAFHNCTSLASITNLNIVPAVVGFEDFFGVNKSACTLTVATSAVSAYQNANVWKDFNIVGGGFLVNPVTGDNEQGK